MAKRNLTSALLIDWRAQLPQFALQKARGAWRVINSGVQLIPWRAFLGPTSGGGTETGITLQCEADGVGNAYVAIVGPPQDVGGEADGVSGPQCFLRVGATIRGETDGIGSAQCFLGGGIISIACLTTGTTSSAPSPSQSVLYPVADSYSY
jgi:hypothetical protein